MRKDHSIKEDICKCLQCLVIFYDLERQNKSISTENEIFI